MNSPRDADRGEPDTGQRNLLFLQQLQQRFDASRGFNFEEALGLGSAESGRPGVTSPHDSDLRRLEYTTLALSGEVGELANVIKKARRSLWLGQTPEPFADVVSDELADILSYVLKISHISKVDLELAYLEKLCRNCMRFPSQGVGEERGHTVTICGLPGSGKSMVANRLDQLYHGRASYDRPGICTFLAPNSGLAANDLEAALRRLLEWLEGTHNSCHLLIDQDPAVAVRVLGSVLRDRGDLSRHGYRELLATLVRMELKLSAWSTRIVVILTASPEVLHTRVSQAHSQLDLDWFKQTSYRLEQFTDELANPIVLDTERLTLEDVVEVISKELHSQIGGGIFNR